MTLNESETVIEIIDLCKSFGSQRVLDHVSMKLYKGENLVVMGKSGCGKSVLVKCIVGLLRPDSGVINIYNENVLSLGNDKLGKVRQQIGFLFQNGALYDSMTVKENMEFPLRRLKNQLTRVAMDKKINEALEQVGLADTIHKMPSQLSGGMRKRISLARTIIVDPSIMLYDEPTTGLDPATSDEISTLINVIKATHNTSSIIITHDIACALATADRIIMLRDGAVIDNGENNANELSNYKNIKALF